MLSLTPWPNLDRHNKFPNSNPYPNLNLNLNLILTWTLKPSLNPQTGLWHSVSKWGPFQNVLTFQKCKTNWSSQRLMYKHAHTLMLTYCYCTFLHSSCMAHMHTCMFKLFMRQDKRPFIIQNELFPPPPPLPPPHSSPPAPAERLPSTLLRCFSERFIKPFTKHLLFRSVQGCHPTVSSHPFSLLLPPSLPLPPSPSLSLLIFVFTSPSHSEGRNRALRCQPGNLFFCFFLWKLIGSLCFWDAYLTHSLFLRLSLLIFLSFFSLHSFIFSL